MSVLGHIGRDIQKKLITTILPATQGQHLVAKFAETTGVLSISHHHARGVGSRRVRTGQLFFAEKDVLLILVEAEHADHVFQSIFKEGNLGDPGTGIIFMEKVLRGHPMMPFDGVDW